MNLTVEKSNQIIKEWVELYSDQLFSWALFKTSQKELAEDLVQETFLVAVKSVDKFQNKSEPLTWLMAILKNKIADHFRKEYKKNTESVDTKINFFDETEDWNLEQKPCNWEIDDEQHLLDNRDFKKVLQNCMQNLPSNWKTAISLKYLEEKESAIICQELGIEPTNYWQILHRAKMQLRKCIELNWFKK